MDVVDPTVEREGKEGGREGVDRRPKYNGYFVVFFTCLIERKEKVMKKRRDIFVYFPKTSILFKCLQSDVYFSEASSLMHSSSSFIPKSL